MQRDGGVRKVSVDPIEVTQKRYRTVEQQRERPGAKSAEVYIYTRLLPVVACIYLSSTGKYFSCTIFASCGRIANI